MRHRKKRLQLNRFTSWRKATLISLMKNLLIYQSIKTTLQKAKAVKPLIDKLISLTKTNTLVDRRRAYRVLGNHKLVGLLFNDIGPRFKNRVGGYARIINMGTRRGDNAKLALLELTEIRKKESKKPKKEKEVKPEEEKKPEIPKKEKPQVTSPLVKKPAKKFLGGIRNIFKKERDSL